MTNYVPLQPLLDYIDRQGGLNHLPGCGVEVEVDIERAPGERNDVPVAGSEFVKTIMCRTAEEEHRYQLIRNRVNNWSRPSRKGRVPYYAADEIACDVFDVHPADIWPDWYAYPEPSVAEVHQIEVEEALRGVADDCETEEVARLARVAA